MKYIRAGVESGPKGYRVFDTNTGDYLKDADGSNIEYDFGLAKRHGWPHKYDTKQIDGRDVLVYDDGSDKPVIMPDGRGIAIDMGAVVDV